MDFERERSDEARGWKDDACLASMWRGIALSISRKRWDDASSLEDNAHLASTWRLEVYKLLFSEHGEKACMDVLLGFSTWTLFTN